MPLPREAVDICQAATIPIEQREVCQAERSRMALESCVTIGENRSVRISEISRHMLTLNDAGLYREMHLEPLYLRR